MTDSESADVKVSFKHLIFVMFGIVALWVANGVILFNWNPGAQGAGGYGTFGDMFGAVNALFSGLAFACLIFATLMQREELKLQRKELQLAREEAAATREEIKGQREGAERQNLLTSRQLAQSLFVELLQQHNLLIDRLRIQSHQLHTGRNCFEELHRFFMNKYQAESKHSPNFDQAIATDCLQKLHFFDGEFGSYFRSLRGLLEYASSDLEPGIKYAHIIRDQLSAHEIVVLFYYWGLTSNTTALKTQIEKFGMLVGIHTQLLVCSENHLGLLDSSAFSE
jgi:uncharacterized membrane protein